MDEQLQEFLYNGIEMRWKPRGNEMKTVNNVVLKTFRVENGNIVIGGTDNMVMFKFYSYHDLFSKDSGIMEFVKWKHDGDVLSHYHMMSSMTSEKKVERFLYNALLPTK